MNFTEIPFLISQTEELMLVLFPFQDKMFTSSASKHFFSLYSFDIMREFFISSFSIMVDSKNSPVD